MRFVDDFVRFVDFPLQTFSNKEIEWPSTFESKPIHHHEKAL